MGTKVGRQIPASLEGKSRSVDAGGFGRMQGGGGTIGEPLPGGGGKRSSDYGQPGPDAGFAKKGTPGQGWPFPLPGQTKAPPGFTEPR